jgi:2-amino-4-hydroxy-6-hydroxymethyldihydropteridine diphosphokinase
MRPENVRAVVAAIRNKLANEIMADVFIALGANLAEPKTQIIRAITALQNLPDSVLLACSPLYRSTPMGPQDQPDYVNAVAKLQTTLAPHALLDELQRIELEQGRARKDERWGPRTLDLDILLYDQLVIDDERLTVPHYGMKERAFVLVPLFDLAPLLTLPDGAHLKDLVAAYDGHDLVHLPD